jgi:uncharacterized protein (DUF952 family)
VYGPLDLPAVVAATPLAVAEDGSYIVPSV